MYEIDAAILHFLNGFFGRSTIFDQLMFGVLQCNSFKMMPIVALMVGVWFSGGERFRRKMIVDGLAGGFLALVVSRLVQNLGPHRPRPIADPSLHFVVPHGTLPFEWSSFPSDTMALGIALTFGIWRASRPAGLFALFWSIVFLAFPKLYTGSHFPSDLVAGAAVGLACTWVWSKSPASEWVFGKIEHLLSVRRDIFYMAAFVVVFQTSTYFDDVRDTGRGLWKALGVEKEAVPASRATGESAEDRKSPPSPASTPA